MFLCQHLQLLLQRFLLMLQHLVLLSSTGAGLVERFQGFALCVLLGLGYCCFGVF
jgi:hypothetical protein